MKLFTYLAILLISSSLYAQIPVNPGGGGGGGGTVTSVSASGGSPIISVSVATATSTPEITLSTPVATPRSLYGNPNAGSIAPVFTIDPMVNSVTANTMTANTFTGALNGAAASAGFATNLFNGALGSVPYQSGANATAFLAGQTTTGIYLLGEQPTGSLIAPTFLNFATLMASPGSIGSGTPGSAAFTTASATTFTGALSGNATTATSATSATSATTATNLAGGTTGGDLPYQSAAGTTSLVTGNITTTNKVLMQVGNATVSAAPIWTTPTGTGSPVLSVSPTLTGMLTTARITLNQATGTAPLTITSTTPVANLTVSNHPTELYCGTTTTCSNTATTGGRVVFGSAAMVSGVAAVTGISPVFPDTNYSCTASIKASGVTTELLTVANTSSSAITITSSSVTSTSTVSYICVR